VGDLKLLAKRAFGQGFLKLVTAKGHVLTNPEDSLQDSGVQEGEHLTAVAQQVKIAASFKAFALWCSGGNQVVAWGNPDFGGDCSAVKDQLRDVQQIQAAGSAFAAILADGSVVTWGRPDGGGDCSAVQDQLRNVQQIQATDFAFAAVLADGSVVAWGKADRGGIVVNEARNVQQIEATTGAFAVSSANGAVVTWGDPDHGGDCSEVQDQLQYL
jgi:alpha-tubulin suppressor-like RCC1 family protein